MPTRLQILKGGLYAGIGFFTPISTFLASDTPLTGRAIAACIVLGLITAGNALKAFTSDPKA
jgi:hypothetical protein